MLGVTPPRDMQFRWGFISRFGLIFYDWKNDDPIPVPSIFLVLLSLLRPIYLLEALKTDIWYQHVSLLCCKKQNSTMVEAHCCGFLKVDMFHLWTWKNSRTTMVDAHGCVRDRGRTDANQWLIGSDWLRFTGSSIRSVGGVCQPSRGRSGEHPSQKLPSNNSTYCTIYNSK